MTKKDYVQGWTGPIERQLSDDIEGTVTAVDGTGKTVALELHDRVGAQVNPSGTVAWDDQSGGTVIYYPADGDLRAASSPYRARWKVTDGSGDDVFYPDDRGEEWKVWPV